MKHAGLVPLFALFVSSGAYAQESDPGRAEGLFQQGRSLLSHGEYAAAREKFAESLAVERSVGTLLNLAECDEHLGHLAGALGEWRQALSLMGPADRRRGLVNRRAASLEDRVGCVTLVLSPEAPDGSIVAFDGQTLAPSALGSASCVDPGPHRWVVQAPGRLARGEVLVLREGEKRTLVVAPGAPLPRPPPSPPAGVRGTSGRTGPRSFRARDLGYGLLGAGGGLVLAGALTAVGVSTERDVIDAHCPGKMCDATGYGALISARALATSSIVLWVVGGLSIASGTVLLGVHFAHKRASISIVPTASTSLVGLTAQGRF